MRLVGLVFLVMAAIAIAEFPPIPPSTAVKRTIAQGMTNVTLAWDPAQGTVLYRLNWGTNSGQYSDMFLTAGTTATVAVAKGIRHYFSVNGIAAPGLESSPSKEFIFPPAAPTNIVIFIMPEMATNIGGPWVAATNAWPVMLTNPLGKVLWRFRIAGTNY